MRNSDAERGNYSFEKFYARESRVCARQSTGYAQLNIYMPKMILSCRRQTSSQSLKGRIRERETSPNPILLPNKKEQTPKGACSFCY